jgi:Domain of unknown function (DUF3597)
MSIFGDIMSAIFGRGASAATPGPAVPSASAPAPQVQPASRGTVVAGPAAQTNVDVAAVLDALAKQKKQKLDWRKSIVDLMKLLDLDSSAATRKHLADELHYQGDKKKSAAMNIWLHKQVMIKLAENGGKVPDDLRR